MPLWKWNREEGPKPSQFHCGATKIKNSTSSSEARHSGNAIAFPSGNPSLYYARDSIPQNICSARNHVMNNRTISWSVFATLGTCIWPCAFGTYFSRHASRHAHRRTCAWPHHVIDRCPYMILCGIDPLTYTCKFSWHFEGYKCYRPQYRGKTNSMLYGLSHGK